MPTNIPISLPPDLQQRLQEAGIEDQAGLDALLARDPDLRLAVQVAIQQWALAHFAEIPDSATLLAWAERFPFLSEPGFTQAVEEQIGQAQAAGQAALAQALQERLPALASLRAQLAGDDAGLPPLVTALLAFLAAEDDEAARRVYIQHDALLHSEEARHTLAYGFAWDDPADWQRSQARARLLAELQQHPPIPPQMQPPDIPALRQELSRRQHRLQQLETESLRTYGPARADCLLAIAEEQAAIAALQRAIDDCQTA